MPSYRAPLRDMRFVFEELLDAYSVLQTLPDQREFTADPVSYTHLADAAQVGLEQFTYFLVVIDQQNRFAGLAHGPPSLLYSCRNAGLDRCRF